MVPIPGIKYAEQAAAAITQPVLVQTERNSDLNPAACWRFIAARASSSDKANSMVLMNRDVTNKKEIFLYFTIF
ncbi:MAG: hypothetical protein BWZ03_00396 [bacterium ADurb.BinA186]|nr:MAG: hypothetical protein BWZ03_00396 [bacterium ADurb.BinA186]